MYKHTMLDLSVQRVYSVCIYHLEGVDVLKKFLYMQSVQVGKCDGYNCTHAANESIYKMVSNVHRLQDFFYKVHCTLTSLLLILYIELVHCYFSTKNQPTVDQISVICRCRGVVPHNSSQLV